MSLFPEPLFVSHTEISDDGSSIIRYKPIDENKLKHELLNIWTSEQSLFQVQERRSSDSLGTGVFFKRHRRSVKGPKEKKTSSWKDKSLVLIELTSDELVSQASRHSSLISAESRDVSKFEIELKHLRAHFQKQKQSDIEARLIADDWPTQPPDFNFWLFVSIGVAPLIGAISLSGDNFAAGGLALVISILGLIILRLRSTVTYAQRLLISKQMDPNILSFSNM